LQRSLLHIEVVLQGLLDQRVQLRIIEMLPPTRQVRLRAQLRRGIAPLRGQIARRQLRHFDADARAQRRTRHRHGKRAQQSRSGGQECGHGCGSVPADASLAAMAGKRRANASRRPDRTASSSRAHRYDNLRKDALPTAFAEMATEANQVSVHTLCAGSNSTVTRSLARAPKPHTHSGPSVIGSSPNACSISTSLIAAVMNAPRLASVAARYMACDRCPASRITARYALAWLRYFQKLRSKRATSAICSGAPAEDGGAATKRRASDAAAS